jgi:hypothetical protein
MEPVVILEVLNDNEEVVRSCRFDSLPIVCGRGYSSDIRLHDAHVCEEHFRIEAGEDSALRIVDLDSVNGIHELPSRTRVKTLEVSTKALIRVGLTHIRVLNTQAPIARAVPLSRKHFPVMRPHVRLWHAALAFFVFTLVFYINNYLLGVRSGENQLFVTLAKALVGGLCLFIPWAAAWALLGRIIVTKFRFPSHLCIILVLTIVYSLGLGFLSYVEFAFAVPVMSIVLGKGVTFLCLFGIISLHLFYATRLRTLKRRLTAGVISFIVVSMFAIVEFKDNLNFSTKIPIQATIKPPWFRYADGISPSDLAKKMETLREDFE